MKQFILLFIFCTSSFFAFGQEYQSYWNAANVAFKNGDYGKAIKDYNNYLELGGTIKIEFITNVKKCETLLGNADVLFDARNYSEAAVKYQELLKLNPSDSHAQKRIAECNNRLKPTTKGEQPTTQAAIPQSNKLKSTTKSEKQSSQPPKRTNFSFGIKGGLNLSNIFNNTTDIDFSPKLKAGFHAGVLFNLRFGGEKGLWGLQPEVLYSRQGFRFDGNNINFDYITVPLMVKLNFGNTSVGNFNFELGPYFSYLITTTPNSAVIIIEENDFFSKTVDINLSDLKNGTDLGVAVGIGYDFKFGLTIGARYNQGLSDMANNLQWKNSVTAISLGFKF